MPLENAGKTILKIKINKKKVTLTFLDKTKLDITYHAYVENYLYENKVLSNKEIKKIKEDSSLEEGLNYSFSLLKKSHLSEHALREKLYKKEFNKVIIDKIVKFLKNNDLIDDEAYILDYMYYAEEALIGKNKIIQDLSNKGIFLEKLKKIKFSDTKERTKAKQLLPLLEKKYSSLNYESKKKHIYDSFIRRGFEQHIILEVLNKLSNLDNKDELNKLDKDFNLLIVKAKRKYEDDKDIHRYVYESLLRKGYKSKHIKIKLEEYYEINR